MELSKNAKYWMNKLGNFSVTKSKEYVKGWALLDDFENYERVYWSARELENLASAANEVAGLLSGNLKTHEADDAIGWECRECKKFNLSSRDQCRNCKTVSPLM